MRSPGIFISKGWPTPALFLAAFGFLLLGVNPTFYTDDSPETITACVTLGIPHPPGYPLYTLLGRLFPALPLGHVTFRVNLLSALLGAAVCAALFGFLSQKLGVRRLLAALFALLWAVGTSTYPAALSAKTGIYELSTLFLVGILWAIFEGWWGLAAFMAGLSLANHWMSMLTFLPGFGLLVYYRLKDKISQKPQAQENQQGLSNDPLSPPPPLGKADRWNHPGGWFLSASFLVIGLSSYLYLPLRSKLNPILNWGDPTTWRNFLYDFLRSQYAGTEGNGGVLTWLNQWGQYFRAEIFEFGGLSLFSLWGARRVYRKYPHEALGLGLLWLGLVGTLGVYLNLPENLYFLVLEYALPAHAILLVLVAWGVETSLSAKDPEARTRWQEGWVLVLGLALALLGAFRFSNSRQTYYTYGYDFELNALKSLPKNALYFCKGDANVFPCWYLQWVEGRRPDVAVVGVDGLPMEWVRRNLALEHPGLRVPKTEKPVGVEAISPMVEWMVAQNPLREFYFSFSDNGSSLIPGVKLVPYGLTGKGFLPDQEPVLDEGRAAGIWNLLRLRHLRDSRFPIDEGTQNRVVLDYATSRNNLGVFYEDLGDNAQGQAATLAKAPDFLKAQHYYQLCFDDLHWAAEWAPDNAQFAYNTGNACFHLGRLDEAMGWYEKATELNPSNPEAYYNWGVAALQKGFYPKAKELFERTLELNPNHIGALKGMDFLKKSGN